MIPGFTAEFSCDQSRGCYYQISSVVGLEPTAVRLAQSRRCYDDCFRQCIESGTPRAECGPQCIDYCQPPDCVPEAGQLRCLYIRSPVCEVACKKPSCYGCYLVHCDGSLEALPTRFSCT
jgi:hypothetical protein